MGIRVKNGGLLTTVQDAGRFGYQRFGMGTAGTMDDRSRALANLLVGNAEDEAVLEVTVLGPTLEFTEDAVLAVTGGDLSPKIDGEILPMYRAMTVKKGSILSFGTLKSGCRAYIAFAGGLEIPVVMGSRSANLKAGLGGVKGRKLEAGDEIAFRAMAEPRNLKWRRVKPDVFSGDYMLRVVPGPQEDRFTAAGLETFFHSTYTVTSDFDRMGCRLTGARVEHTGDANIISDGISRGAIQIPDSGEPIIMLSDRQTTGGYTKIGSVITADLPLIAQCKAGDKVHFTAVGIEEAQDAIIAEKKEFSRLKQFFDTENRDENSYSVYLDGQVLEAKIEWMA